MVRMAVVGVNRIGMTHCRVYAGHPDSELVAVCDLLPERAHQAAKTFGARAYTDVAAMIAAEKPDAISVATAGPEGGGHHMAPALAAIDAGVDVLVEKPLSNRIGEARQLVAQAKARGVRLACNLNHRFSPAADKARALISSGELGQILFVNMRLTIRNPNEETPWIHMRALHSHSIDVMRHMAGDVRRVQAFMTKAPGRTVWSTASVNMEFVSGAVGHLTGSYDMSMKHPIEFCEVAGDRGRLIIDNVFESLTFYPPDGDEARVYRNPLFGGLGTFDDTFARRLGRFVEQVRDKADPTAIEGSGAEALAALEVVEAAIASQQQNGAVIDLAKREDDRA
jgi:UDP-N-acetylglucosamine 3-dehydrogenase